MSVLSSLAGPPSINGALSFPSGGAAFGGAIGGPLGSAYSSAYNSALQQNQQMYGNILSGYQNVLANQGQAQQQISGGYGALANQVQQGIQGITASQQQAIQDVYAQQMGQQQQGLINAGLGNTTVQGAMARGLTLDEQKAQIALANQQAQLQAGYQSQLGLAGLGYQNQAIQQNTAQANNQLGFMNSVQMQYPNAQSYGQLSSAQAALQLAQQWQQMYGNALHSGQNVAPSPVIPSPAGNFAGPSQPLTGAGLNQLNPVSSSYVPPSYGGNAVLPGSSSLAGSYNSYMQNPDQGNALAGGLGVAATGYGSNFNQDLTANNALAGGLGVATYGGNYDQSGLDTLPNWYGD